MRPTWGFSPGAIYILDLLFILSAQGRTLPATTETSEGLKIEVLLPTECSRQSENGDTVHVHYNGTLGDGTAFDSSYSRNDPFAFRLGGGQVIRGWDLGLLDMCIGEERRLTIPPDLAYGNRAIGIIPAGSTLYFDTKLMAIDGVPEQTPIQPPIPSITPLPITSTTSTSSLPARPTATLPPDSQDPVDSPPGAENGECRLLGRFALIVQGSLGIIALFSLVIKRYRERPRRPLKIWFFDASKQIVGSVLLHILNLVMSMISSSDFEIFHHAQRIAATLQDAQGRMPNPCSFYLMNLAVDTTIGIPILVVFLKLLHAGFSLTPLANPPESIRSGHYGHPPRAAWWLKQSIIYFLGLLLMKLCVFFIFQLLPWIAWVGDWALRWTEGSEALQITFVMFVFPVIMNALQYYIIDSFIKDPSGGEGHQALPTSDRDSDETRGSDDLSDDGYPSGREDDDEVGGKKPANIVTKEANLARAEPRLARVDEEDGDDESSAGSSRIKEMDDSRTKS